MRPFVEAWMELYAYELKRRATMDFFDSPKRKPNVPPDAGEFLKYFHLRAFPGGQAQIEEETRHVQTLLDDKLSKAEARSLVAFVKAILLFSGKKSPSQVTERILKKFNGIVSLDEAQRICAFVRDSLEPVTEGGDGSSPEEAVVINATSTMAGIAQETAYIERICGKRGEDYTPGTQTQVNRGDRKYDVQTVTMNDGATREFWFDITSFFGKW
jgi:hypothetical protein